MRVHHDSLVVQVLSCARQQTFFLVCFQGLSEKATIKEVRRWRESEVTHGRVAMLAALGFIVGEQLSDFPLFFNFDGRVSGEPL